MKIYHHYKLIGILYNPFSGRCYHFECKVCGMPRTISVEKFWGEPR